MVGVVLTDGISRVVLAPAGPPALGYPTRVEIATGPFSATVEAEALDYKRFLDALRRIHESLAGEAELTFVEGGHSVTLTGNGRGSVVAMIVVGDGQSPGHAALTVRMTLDQSYLPDIIHAIQREFLSPSKADKACHRLQSSDIFWLAKALPETEKIAKGHGRNERALEPA